MSDKIDPVLFEVVWHRLLDITEEMGIKYMRTSGSPILVGAYDASTGITLPDGKLVAMGPYISTQAHVLRLIVDSVIKQRMESPGINPGDMFICNDPYLGATHQPDVATVAPVHHSGALRAWVGSSGHWLDIGGSEPGGFNMTATSVFDEGLRLPPTKIVEGHEIREDIVDLIMAQVREPLAELDLRGQLVANEVGRNRLLEVADEVGPSVLDDVMRRGISHVAGRLRSRLRSLPDGLWREVQYLDHDGHKQNVRKIVCTLTKSGDHLTLDFAGSDAQVEGFANTAFGGLRAAVLSGVCIALGYDLTWNDGAADCVEIKAPRRTIVTAEYPTPVSMSTISAIIVTLNLVLVVLSRMLLASPRHHEQAMASWCATSLGVSMVGVNRDGTFTVAPEASHFAAGAGARSYADGVDTGGIIINTTANIPSIEATEDAYPLLYLFRRQLTDSGGAGRFRGGASGEVAIVPYESQGPLSTSFAGVGSLTPNAVGLAGGLPGASVRYLRFLDAARLDPESEILGLVGTLEQIGGKRTVGPLNSSKIEFGINTVEYHNWQGGGGFGDALDRDPAKVLTDVRTGLVSADEAFRTYGVVLTVGTTIELDGGGTEEHRQELRKQRLQRAVPFTDSHPLVLPESLTAQEPESGVEREQVNYWNIVAIDNAVNTMSCMRCGTVLGSATMDVRHGCVIEEVPAATIGPIRGEDYAEDYSKAGGVPIAIRSFYCPGCGRRLEADLVVPGEVGPSSVIFRGGVNTA
ncbi:hydantoinase B/oxoprolinase family protein [Pseudarthrobacter sp. NamE2]|uniref:hydantoinase B/oxoprolinase family protein n=1 Tax=Pseudarthrobacter sp. NamE2 TaxID=2576838 RepID=UPI001484FCB2|nr:hydantoinase B/oxoprolinase family protein [Pseudarthrobacter sp. NamE2]